MLWLLPASVVVGSVVVLSRRARASTSGPDLGTRRTRHVTFDDRDTVDVRALAASVDAPRVWQDFFALVARGESRSRPDVGLGVQHGAPLWIDMNHSNAEAKAAAAAYTSNLSWLQGCWPKDLYTFGSGGLFGLLPAAGLAAFRDDPTYRCAHPWSIFDPSPTMVYAAWFARRLQGWETWRGTVVSARVGWGAPKKMHKPPSNKKMARWAEHCKDVGLDPSFLLEALPKWRPPPPRELWNELGADNGWLPDREAA